jgi:hypothetical protein
LFVKPQVGLTYWIQPLGFCPTKTLDISASFFNLNGL